MTWEKLTFSFSPKELKVNVLLKSQNAIWSCSICSVLETELWSISIWVETCWRQPCCRFPMWCKMIYSVLSFAVSSWKKDRCPTACNNHVACISNILANPRKDTVTRTKTDVVVPQSSALLIQYLNECWGVGGWHFIMKVLRLGKIDSSRTNWTKCSKVVFP